MFSVMIAEVSHANSLTFLSSKCISKNWQQFNFKVILSKYEWPPKVISSLLSCLPLNKILDLEELLSHFDFTIFWKHLVNQCSCRHAVFSKRSKISLDPFLPSCAKSFTEVGKFHPKEVLLNGLFQEALDIAMYTKTKKCMAAPAFLLHSALEKNKHDLDIFSWLTLLAGKITCLALHPRHIEIFHSNNELIKLKKNCTTIELMLNPRLKAWKLFEDYCKVLKNLLMDSGVKRVVFCNQSSVVSVSELLNICSGMKINFTRKRKLSQDADMWDEALGGKGDFSQSVDSDNIYENFTTNPSEKFVQETKGKHGISELVLEPGGLHQRLQLSKWLTLKALKLSKPQALSSTGHPIIVKIIKETELLMTHPFSQLDKLYLVNIYFTCARITALASAIHSSFLFRGMPFGELQLADCELYSEIPQHCHDMHSDTNSANQGLDCLIIENLLFHTSKVQVLFCLCMFKKLQPKEISIYGDCKNKEQRDSVNNVNVEMFTFLNNNQSELEYAKFRKATLYLIAPIPMCLASQIISSLEYYKLEHFTLYYNENHKLPELLHESLSNNIKRYKIVPVHVAADYLYTAEDFVSQM